MKLLRASGLFLGPPAAALAVAFWRHPEFWDAAGTVLVYFAISYWLVIIPWAVIAARLAPPDPPGPRLRLALASAGCAAAYVLFWWGGAGVGVALLVLAILPRANWIAPGS